MRKQRSDALIPEEKERRRIANKARYRATAKGRETERKYAIRNRYKYPEYRKRYYQKHRERIVPIQRERLREYFFVQALAKYDLTRERYFELSARGCMLCGGVDTAGKRLSIDHDHATGKFRGLLCGTCNTRLGWYERRAEKIAAYLCP